MAEIFYQYRGDYLTDEQLIQKLAIPFSREQLRKAVFGFSDKLSTEIRELYAEPIRDAERLPPSYIDDTIYVNDAPGMPVNTEKIRNLTISYMFAKWLGEKYDRCAYLLKLGMKYAHMRNRCDTELREKWCVNLP